MEARLLWFYMAIALLLSCARAEDQKNPLRNVNLSPFRQWRSAYFCLKNESATCSGKDKLTLDGVVDVSDSEVDRYCGQGGCVEHTTAVLQCVFYAKRDFWFANKITVKELKEVISYGCTHKQGFSTVNYTVGGAKKAWH